MLNAKPDDTDLGGVLGRPTHYSHGEGRFAMQSAAPIIEVLVFQGGANTAVRITGAIESTALLSDEQCLDHTLGHHFSPASEFTRCPAGCEMSLEPVSYRSRKTSGAEPTTALLQKRNVVRDSGIPVRTT